MVRINVRSFRLLAMLGASLGAIGVAASARGAVAAWNLVSAYDPNNGGGQINISDLSNTPVNDGVSLTQFTTDVASAYTGGLGGTFNWENGSGGSSDPATQLTAIAANGTEGYNASNNIEGYGSSPAYAAGSGAPATVPIISFYRSDVNSSSSAALDWNSNQGAILASGPSGGGYLGIQGTSSYSLTFQPAAGYGVTEFGFTDIARDTSGQTSGGSFTVHFSDGSAITSTTAASLTSTTSTPGTGAFYGFVAPSGLTITSLDWANSSAGTGSASRFDDLGVIVAPVPEPASLGLLSLGGIALLARRRRHA